MAVLISTFAPATVSAAEIASTTSTSPSGEEVTIGWSIPESTPTKQQSRASSEAAHRFETKESETGLQTLIMINQNTAPNTYRFPLTLPPGSEIVEFSEDSAESMGIFLDGDLIATIAHPWAHDSNGRPIPTTIAIEDGALVQHVDHNGSTSFPITADPQIDWGWEKTTIKLSKKETQATGAAGGAGAITALPWMAALGVTGPAGAAILAAAAKPGFNAIRAHHNNNCLGIIVNTNVASSNGGISTYEFRCS
ncbi:hypothetical protein [Corynebacterium uterequi]|uniref:Uncharacterized protein n=1 Tax=Corynebacterium uterequi TaxID=1072256 RepID=A0A0G3HJG4_9CORY|nr:hypothetical protein [Corynebacterium uterequi]AKK12093.1 hypothetical protein CUTER_10645 [Corynebacterium uterequi]